MNYHALTMLTTNFICGVIEVLRIRWIGMVCRQVWLSWGSVITVRHKLYPWILSGASHVLLLVGISNLCHDGGVRSDNWYARHLNSTVPIQVLVHGTSYLNLAFA